MTTDHNEAMRLAGELVAPIGTQTSYQTAHEAAALLRKQAERIAELEAERTKLVATVAYDTTMVFDLCAERDTLRAEVERLRVDAERWHVANLTAETAWKHPDHRSPEENTAFSAYRCAVEDGLNFEGAVDAAVTAIDNARKATP